ncbi:MAG: hypothetical protein ACRC0R_02420, partial [Cetobacterium sp.]
MINKKTGFNLEKTDLTENESDKLFSAKGALNLFNNLTTNFTDVINTAKEVLRGDISKKEDKFEKNSGFNKVKTDSLEDDTNKLFTSKGAFNLNSTLTKLINEIKTTLTSHTELKATSSKDGHISKEDKSKLDGIATGANNYSHPTSSGNKHIPTGGSVNRYLKWLSDGTPTWELVDWSIIQNKPSSFPTASHNHDDRYFTETEINEKFKNFCPIVVGALLILDSTANPATLYPNTTWSKIENRFLYGSASPSATGGRSSVALALANIPAHNHSASQGAHTHTANHNHTATQASHIHTQPSHVHEVTQFISTSNIGSYVGLG